MIPRDLLQAGKFVYLTSIQSDWGTANSAPETVDTTYLTNPSTLISGNNARIIPTKLGTSLLVRCKYDDGTAGTLTSPIIKVFGVDNNGAFHLLKNSASTPANTATLTLAPSTDVTDGTYKYSDVTSSHAFDLQGSKFFIVVISTALASTEPADVLNNSTIEYKVV